MLVWTLKETITVNFFKQSKKIRTLEFQLGLTFKLAQSCALVAGDVVPFAEYRTARVHLNALLKAIVWLSRVPVSAKR